ncbi:MAG TPA: NADH-quinone oxidoreductase subunit M [Elusimicrobiota bacterium]|jgi:NADH-quinone oxidoreductase subunit M|nr:NADH-quinone oxidoreductase subunit M [Elusimicrobiota bacterium]
MPILSLITFLPLAGSLAILFIPKEKAGAVRATAIAATGAAFLLSLLALAQFEPGGPQLDAVRMQFVERYSWIPTFDIHYYLGVDGLSLPLIVLTTLLSLLAAVYSMNITVRVKEFYFWFLALEVGMIGVFAALDFFLFYMFWELTLVPMYFLIGVWGGPKKEFAAIKFFLFTLFGSVFMLLGILALYFSSNPHTFDMLELMKASSGWSKDFQVLVFLAFYLGFAVKVPAFPFHTWLPLAHVEAPTGVSVILAGVLLKMGVYGLMRVCYQILPAGFDWFLPWLVVIAFINIVYGALCAMAQTDMKKMVAYSSVNHMGYCLLGLAAVSATGFNGAVLQMINHGLITGALFLLVGVIYDRAHTRDISAFGGLAAKLPVYAALMSLTCFASLGLPGLAGFISEFLCFLGAFHAWKLYTTLSVIGILVTAAFFLRMLQKVFLGPLNAKWADLPDMDGRELISVAPLAALTVLFGVWPKLLLDVMNPTVTYISKMFPDMFQAVRHL